LGQGTPENPEETWEKGPRGKRDITFGPALLRLKGQKKPQLEGPTPQKGKG